MYLDYQIALKYSFFGGHMSFILSFTDWIWHMLVTSNLKGGKRGIGFLLFKPYVVCGPASLF